MIAFEALFVVVIIVVEIGLLVDESDVLFVVTVGGKPFLLVVVIVGTPRYGRPERVW